MPLMFLAPRTVANQDLSTGAFLAHSSGRWNGRALPAGTCAVRYSKGLSDLVWMSGCLGSRTFAGSLRRRDRVPPTCAKTLLIRHFDSFRWVSQVLT